MRHTRRQHDARSDSVAHEQQICLCLARASGRWRNGNIARCDNDQTPRGGFGGAQQPERGAVEMAGYRPHGAARVNFVAQRRCLAEPDHGDKQRKDSLQRLAIDVDCRIPVHRRRLLPRLSRVDCQAGLAEVDRNARRATVQERERG